jgi:C4-dicarboxylate-specific signal transduction histidine kinase/CheY-like chemotaxis protein
MIAIAFLVSSLGRKAALQQLLDEVEMSGVEVHVYEDLTESLARYARKPAAVVAVLPETEAEAILALAAGADESVEIEAIRNATNLVAVIDRARARAEGRTVRDSLRDTVVHAEKLRALGTVVAGVAHEVNNPLAAISLSLEQLRSNVEPLLAGSRQVRAMVAGGRVVAPEDSDRIFSLLATGAPEGESEQIFEELTACISTIADVVRDLAVFSRAEDSDRRELIYIPKLIEQVLRIVGRDLRHLARIEREFLGEELMVVAPRARLVQVFSNLLINAAQAIREAGGRTHRLRISCRSDESSLIVSFADTGVGIREADLDRVFDTFYTTKGEGTGLGLSISRAIARSLGGDLLVESVHGQGANFLCILPQATAEDILQFKVRAPAGRKPPSPQTRVSLMLVDPDSRVLRSLPRVLRDEYDVITAGDATEAIELLQSGSAPSAILSELDLPDVSGPAFWAWMTQHRPNLCPKTVFVTSPTVAREYSAFVAALPNAILEKPFARAALTQILERLRTS